MGQRERDCWSVRQRYVLEGGEGRRLWGRNSEEQTLGPVVVQGHFSNQYDTACFACRTHFAHF